MDNDQLQRFQQLLEISANPELRMQKAKEMAARMAPPPLEMFTQGMPEMPIPQGMQPQTAAPAQPQQPMLPMQGGIPPEMMQPVQNPTNPNAQIPLGALIPGAR